MRNLFRQNINYFIFLRKLSLFVHTEQKCYYPSCVGQTSKSWVTSPLGLKLLAMMLGDEETHKSVQMLQELSHTCCFKTENKLLLRPQCKKQSELKVCQDVKLEVVETHLKRNGMKQILQWGRKCMKVEKICFEAVELEKVDYILMNISTYNTDWCDDKNERVIKAYNSFSYTQDTQYETRVIELSTVEDDFRVVILVPNDTDEVHTLFRRLCRHGLTATLSNIRPYFTTVNKINSPCVDICSETEFVVDKCVPQSCNATVIQYGNVKIDECGAQVNVMTCVYSGVGRPVRREKECEDKRYSPFFFAVVFRDIPIFTGQFLKFCPEEDD